MEHVYDMALTIKKQALICTLISVHASFAHRQGLDGNTQQNEASWCVEGWSCVSGY